MKEPEDDPFGMFGADESDGEAEAEAIDQAGKKARLPSRTLVEGAKRSLGHVGEGDHATLTFPVDPADSREAVDAGDVKNCTGYSLSRARPTTLPWRAPLYLAPSVQLVSEMESVGGGRGYVLAPDSPDAAMPAGTLVLIEAPLIEWPEEQIGHELGLVSVRHILRTVDETSLHELEHLHPTKQAVDQSLAGSADGNNDNAHSGSSFETQVVQTQVVQMMDRVREDHKNDPQLQEIVHLASRRGLSNSDGSPIIDTDCFRLLLALRYNGLQSGVYLHVAMLNHADQPNCVKFMPSADSRGQARFSEVRTTRPVLPGEALTIHYLPSIRSHATRRHDLWEQHRFDIGESGQSTSLRAGEMVHGRFPPSSVTRRNSEAVTSRVESATDDLRQLYGEASSFLSSRSPLPSSAQINQASSNEDSMIEQIRALELSFHGLVASAQEKLGNPRHILLLPALELHLDCASLVLQHDSDLKPTARQTLLQLQGSNPTQYYLPAMLMQPMSTVAAWTSLEHRVRNEHVRIRDLYPHDSAERVA
jgi:hypothetical protein